MHVIPKGQQCLKARAIVSEVNPAHLQLSLENRVQLKQSYFYAFLSEGC